MYQWTVARYNPILDVLLTTAFASQLYSQRFVAFHEIIVFREQRVDIDDRYIVTRDRAINDTRWIPRWNRIIQRGRVMCLFDSIALAMVPDPAGRTHYFRTPKIT